MKAVEAQHLGRLINTLPSSWKTSDDVLLLNSFLPDWPFRVWHLVTLAYSAFCQFQESINNDSVNSRALLSLLPRIESQVQLVLGRGAKHALWLGFRQKGSIAVRPRIHDWQWRDSI
jgi:hypothetical protein